MLRYFTNRELLWVLVGMLIIDMLLVGGFLYALAAPSPNRALAAILPQPPTVTVTTTSTPWPGPGARPSPTATWPPTPLPTDVLAETGWPPGFTPTPRPTREPVYVSLPSIFPMGARSFDVPVINQIHYPEPFFPPGTNNACGPIALYAGFLGLGANLEYNRLRDVAVSYGFNAEGITKEGLTNTAVWLNEELGRPYTVEAGDQYNTQHLMALLRQKAIIIVLVQVKKENGEFRVTNNQLGSFGHFLVVDYLSLSRRQLHVAGSSLGMSYIPLDDFLESWTGHRPGPDWKYTLKHEPATNWALIIKRRG